MQNSQGITFLGENLIAIGGIGLLMFVYVIFLVRKRWKKGFMHDKNVRKE